MTTHEQKEILKQKILNCNSSYVKDYDFSLFGDDDVDVFEKLVSYDGIGTDHYPQLSDTLKNNQKIAVQAAKCFTNIPYLPIHFFNDKEVIKSIVYAQRTDHIPSQYLTGDMVNHMFELSAGCSEDIKSLIDQYLKKDTVISVLKKRNHFYNQSIKKNAHPSLSSFYLPSAMYKDPDIVKLLYISNFSMVKDNPLVDRHMILSLASSDNVIAEIPERFFQDIDLIKICLRNPHNYRIFNNMFILNRYKTEHVSQQDIALLEEFVQINPHVLDCYHFPISFTMFQQFVEADYRYLLLANQVLPQDEEPLYHFLTQESIVELFKKENDNYDFSLLYSTSNYYKNPLMDNPFLIKQIAQTDKAIFHYIGQSLVQDNELMYQLLIEYQIHYDHQEYPGEHLSRHIDDCGGWNQYIDMLTLHHNLHHSLEIKASQHQSKI